MKKRTLILAVLAVVLVLSASIGSAVAYFTTYATARGGYVNIGKYPVFVRVKAFADSDGTLDYDANAGSLWQPKNDGYWYYQKPLYAGTAAHPEGAVTDPFVVTINLNRALKEGEELDVIVVYDSVAAVFNADGSPDLDTAWATGDIQVVNP